jgi:hypothetical protein
MGLRHFDVRDAYNNNAGLRTQSSQMNGTGQVEEPCHRWQQPAADA